MQRPSTGKIQQVRVAIQPGLRGAIYYAIFWGAVAIADPYINIHLMSLGLTGSQIGLVGAISPLMTLTFAPLVSRLADRRAWRVTLLAVLAAGASGAFFLMGLTRMVWLFVFGVGLLALFRSPMFALGDGLVARLAVHHKLDFGNMRLWGSFCYALLAIAFGILWQKVGMHWMFVAASGAYLLVILSSLLLEEDIPTQPHSGGSLGLLGSNGFLMALFGATVLMGGAIFISISFIGVYMKHLGGGDNLVGWLMGVSALCEIPTMFFGARLLKRIGDLGTLLLAYLLLGVGFLGFALTSSPYVLIGMAAIRGVGYGLFTVTTVVLVDRHAPAGLSATVQALVNAGAFGIAPLLASPLGGWVYEYISPQATFIVCVVLAGLAMMTLLGITRFNARPGKVV